MLECCRQGSLHGKGSCTMLTWPRSTSGAVHSGVPAWLLADIQVLLRTRDSPKSHTCQKHLPVNVWSAGIHCKS